MTTEIWINRQRFVVEADAITGAELRRLSTPPIPDDHELFIETMVLGDDDRVEDDQRFGPPLIDRLDFFSYPSQTL